MKIFRASPTSRNANRRNLAMNRRATFMLVLGSAASLAAQSSQARAEVRASEHSGAMPAAGAGKSGDWSNQKAASASQLRNLKAVEAEHQVVAIHHHGNSFEVATADGRKDVFPDVSLRIKIDASDNGPLAGKPVILPGGMIGDRATLFFASPAEISAVIKYRDV